MEAIARKYFVESKKEHYWRCICGKEKKCAPKSGWTNLISHIRKQHPEQNFAKSDENFHQQKITNAFGGTTLGAENIHNWLEWVCCELKPFSFIESELTRKNVKLQPISMKTALQRENVDISQIRLLFDGTLKRFPELDEAKKYITKDATIVKSPAFERGVQKIQDEDEKNLTLEEKLAVKNLRRSVNADTESDETDSGDFASEILKKKRKVAAKSSYIDTRFIQPTSNMVERFFSSAGFAASELRQNISPVHLEEQLYLKANKRFWNVQLVNEVFNC